LREVRKRKKGHHGKNLGGENAKKGNDAKRY